MDIIKKVAFIRKNADFLIRVTMMFVTALVLADLYYKFQNIEIAALLLLYLVSIITKGILLIFSKKDD